MTQRRGILVDTFSGFGGLSLGLEQAGFDVMVGVDVEPVNTAIHSYNYSYGRSLCLDLHQDQTAQIRKAMPSGVKVDALTMARPIDAIVGGPPCQGISAIGKKRADDERNELMASFIRHGINLEAKYMIMEQVPTLLQEVNEHIIDEIREDLHKAGYSLVDPKVMRAIDFGVPQRRERVFLLIHRNDQPAPEYPTPTHGAGGDLFAKMTPTVADAFDGLPDCDEYDELWDRDWTNVNPDIPLGRYARLMRGLENDCDDLSYKRDWNPSLLTCSQRTRHEEESIKRFVATQPGKNERISRRHRLDPHGQSLTLRAGSNAEHGSFTAVVPIHTKGTRVITVREGCRLHSVPDWVRLSSSKIAAYRQLGNSVPPLLARAIGRQIMRALDLSPAAPADVIPYGAETLLHTTSIKEIRNAA